MASAATPSPSAKCNKGRHASAIQNELMLAALTKFFSKPDPLNILLSIINGTSNLSLRLIDWFVTNYCRTNNIIIIRSLKNGATEHINVYNNYRSQLRSFSKHLFDPFRRQDKIAFHAVQTTIGQLNFFRWAIENEVLEYIQDHYSTILYEMNMMANKTAVVVAKTTPMRPDASQIDMPEKTPKGGGGRRMISFD